MLIKLHFTDGTLRDMTELEGGPKHNEHKLQKETKWDNLRNSKTHNPLPRLRELKVRKPIYMFEYLFLLPKDIIIIRGFEWSIIICRAYGKA